MAATDATPLPKKNVAYRVTFPIFDADGDLVAGAATLDSEISKDGGTFADCTNEATEIATSSGMYFLDLTATEMNADTVAVIVKTGTAGAKTTPIVLYPEEAGDIRVDVTMVSGDATAADNCELFFDGTGYAAANSTVGTVTTVTNGVNVSQISGDSVAADNCELFFDGTGYAAANSTIGTVTTLTNGVDVTSISGDATAADNCELFFDGTGYAAANSTVGTVTNVTNAVNTTAKLTSGTAQAGAASTITLAAGESATNDLFNGARIILTGGTGAGQSRLVTDYVGATKVATVDRAWVTNPGADTTYQVLGADSNAAMVSGDATAADNLELFFDGTGYAAANSTVGTVTDVTNGVDVASISGDAAAADNLELFFDGTGYAAANSTVGTVTTVTNGVNVSQISGDTTAADNCELFFDGTGYNASNSAIGTVATATTVTNGVNVTQIAGNTEAATDLSFSARTIVTGTVDTGSFTATTTEFELSDVTEATADHFNGRIIIFTSGALKDQATDITDYALSGANGHFTVTAMTEAPANGDTLVIV